MNPARSLGPALVSGRLAEVWIYLIAPTLGALLAIPLHRILHPPTPSTPPQNIP
jgi:glycerol uptake facilitator-like aquaporin